MNFAAFAVLVVFGLVGLAAVGVQGDRRGGLLWLQAVIPLALAISIVFGFFLWLATDGWQLLIGQL
ncbi:hypothetical protein HYW68_00095 [Candidatus Parcubacteria bacterium]|nr:hypothetical protein [Candidatus Parcubacteria bacterium]